MNICANCQQKFKGHSRYQLFCNNCVELNKNGGIKMTPTQEQYNNAANNKIVKKKKETITNKRILNAEDVIVYMKESLQIDFIEMRKVISRAYSIITKKIKEVQ